MATQRPRNTTNNVKADEAISENDAEKVEAIVEKVVANPATVIDLNVDEVRILSSLVADLYKSKRKGMTDMKRDVTGRTSALMMLVGLKAKLDAFISANATGDEVSLPDSI